MCASSKLQRDSRPQLSTFTKAPDLQFLRDAQWLIAFVRARAMDVQAVSAVGAGDSFVGEIAWSLAAGHSAVDAFRWGVAAGSAAVLNPEPIYVTPQTSSVLPNIELVHL